MSELSQSTKKLISCYQFWHQSLQPKGNLATIHVDEVASRVAAFYEKIREVVDWREEHLMRKAAIERNLKRRLLLKQNGDDIATPLVLELIRGGHFPNDKIEESKISEVQKALDKYIFILENAPPPSVEKLKFQLYDWILGVAACEVEGILEPPQREIALIEYMDEIMKERIKLSPLIKISELEKEAQIYVAIQKALFKFDAPLIYYNLLKREYADWKNLSPQLLEEITKNIYQIWEKLEKIISHPLAEKFYRICEKYDTPFLILNDIITANTSESQKNLENPEILESQIQTAYNKRAKTLKERLSRAALYATLSIFITKMLLALAVEIPFDKYVTGQFSYPALGFNVVVPPLLMFFIVLSIRLPRKENLQVVTMEVMKIVYATERKDAYEIKPRSKRGFVINAIINIFYVSAFVISFGLIFWGLQKIEFGILSIIIFLIFISLISFAGVRIRERSRELDIIEEKETFFTFIFDLFALPIIRVGKWLSGQWAKYNVIVVFMNFLIDMPFQVFVEFLEQWRYFLKEKKEEIH
jgi:hypothetical protein